MPSSLQPDNPFTLFLILVLLILSTNPKVEEHLAFLMSFIERTQLSVRSFKEGTESFHSVISLLSSLQ